MSRPLSATFSEDVDALSHWKSPDNGSSNKKHLQLVEYDIGFLVVRKIICRNLKNVEMVWGDKNDVFVDLSFVGESMKTEVLDNAGSYAEYELLDIKFTADKSTLESSRLIVRVFDENTLTADVMIGKCVVDPSKLLLHIGGDPVEFSMDITDNNNVVTGNISLFLEVAPKMAPPEFDDGYLIVKKIVCSSLKNVEMVWGDKNDVYVVVEFAGELKKTEVLDNVGTDAKYESVDMKFVTDRVSLESEELIVRVFDENSLSSDVLIGECKFTVSKLLSSLGLTVEFNYDISDPSVDSAASGKVSLSLTALSVSLNSPLDLVNFISENKDLLRDRQVFILAKFEELTKAVLESNSSDSTLLRIIRSHGWNGSKFRDSTSASLNPDALLISLTNLYLNKNRDGKREGLKALMTIKDDSSVALAYETENFLSFIPNVLLWQLGNTLTWDSSAIIDGNLPVQISSPSCASFRGAVMLADISGFSKFAAAKCALGVVGLNELHEATSSYLGHCIHLIYKYGGDVVAFAGDALICTFLDDTGSSEHTLSSCSRAVQCALRLVKHVTTYYSAHIAIAYGDMKLAVLGGLNDEWIYLLNGPCMQTLGDCINDAGSKQVAISPECYAKISEDVDISQIRIIGLGESSENVKGDLVTTITSSGNYVVEKMTLERSVGAAKNASIIKLPSDRIRGLQSGGRNVDIADVARLFVPRPVLSAVYSGSMEKIAELRQVVTIFVSLDSYSVIDHLDPLTMQPYFTVVQKALQKTEGYLRQFIIDDKGCCVIAMWGVPQFSHQNDSLRGLYCAAMILQGSQDIGLQVSIGMTTGYGYCSDIGASLRRDYVVVSHEVNMAARLMGKAKGRILIDESSRSFFSPAVKNMLQPGEALQLKGASEPVIPYIYTGADIFSVDITTDTTGSNSLLRPHLLLELGAALDRISNNSSLTSNGSLTMRQKSSNRFKSDSEKTKEAARLSSCIILLGEPGTGKSSAVHFLTTNCANRSIEVLQIRALFGDETVPYAVCRKLFFELLDRDGGTVGTDPLHRIDDIKKLIASAYKNISSDAAVLEEVFSHLKTILQLDERVKQRRIESQRKKNASNRHINAFSIVFSSMLAAFGKRGVVVVIQDAHYCDEYSWDEIYNLVAADRAAPVASFLITMRTPMVVVQVSSPLLKRALFKQLSYSMRQSSVDELSSGLAVLEVQSIDGQDTNISSMVQKEINGQQISQRKTSKHSSLSSRVVSLLKTGSLSERMSIDIKTSSGGISNVKIYGGMQDHDEYRIQGVTFRLPASFKRLTSDAAQTKIIELTLFDENDVKGVVSASLSEDLAATILCSPDMVRSILKMTGGSSYWCAIVIAFIRDNGIDAFKSSLTGEKGNQDSLRRIIVNQLDALTSEQQVVIKHASIIGLEFTITMLTEILPKKIQPLVISELEILQSNGLVRCIAETPTYIYAFDSPLVRITIYDALSLGDKSAAHLAIAKFIERTCSANLRNYYLSLSYHFRQVAGYRNMALRYTVKAADYAISRRAYATASGCIETSLPLLQTAAECNLLIQIVTVAIADLSELSKRLQPVIEQENLIQRYSTLKEKLSQIHSKLSDSSVNGDNWGVSEATLLDVTPILTRDADSFLVNEDYRDNSLDRFGRGMSKNSFKSFYGLLDTELSYSHRRSRESKISADRSPSSVSMGCSCTVS